MTQPVRIRHTLPYVESFHTIQGEGPAAGRSATFIRFGGCNLSCSWCDSAYTWDASRYHLREEIQLRSAEDILRDIKQDSLYVITGGEPLLNQNNPEWDGLLGGLIQLGRPNATIHFETNGTILPNKTTLLFADKLIISPKLPNAGLHKSSQSPAMHPGWKELREAYLGDYDNDELEMHLKFVVKTKEDVAEAVHIAQSHGWPPERVWIMPEGVTAEVLNERWPMVAEQAALYGINASHRLHVLAWGEKRGH